MATVTVGAPKLIVTISGCAWVMLEIPNGVGIVIVAAVNCPPIVPPVPAASVAVTGYRALTVPVAPLVTVIPVPVPVSG